MRAAGRDALLLLPLLLLLSQGSDSRLDPSPSCVGRLFLELALHDFVRSFACGVHRLNVRSH